MQLSISQFYRVFLFAVFDGLGEAAPTFCCGEGRAEIVVLHPRAEGEFALGTVVAVSADGHERAVAGHGAGVVITALDFVVRVAIARQIPIVNRFANRQPFFQHAFPDHVGGNLPLESGHALIQISRIVLLATFRFDLPVRKRAHDQSRVAFDRVPTPIRHHFPEVAHVG